jgi:uncharacterized protein YdeI (YjbR/CyaY-like superfamily)
LKGWTILSAKIPDQPLHFQDRDAWRQWLEHNHAERNEAWLVILKNQAAGPGIHYEEAVEEALCYGWIDSFMKGAPGDSYFLRFSPRKPGSLWSVSNQQRVERLLAQGKMTEAGLAKVQEARENGEWQAAIRREDTSSLPEDLRRALESHPGAQANFDQLPALQKKQTLYWLASAKTEATRQKRLRQIIDRAAGDKPGG